LQLTDIYFNYDMKVKIIIENVTSYYRVQQLLALDIDGFEVCVVSCGVCSAQFFRCVNKR